MARASDTPDDAFVRAPEVEVPAAVVRENARDIDRLLKPQRPRRMSILGLLLAFALAGAAAFVTATVIAPSSGAGIASVGGGASKVDVDNAFATGKSEGYAAGIKAGRATERKAAEKRQTKAVRQGFTRGLKKGRDDGKRKGFTEGYRSASETYAAAVAQASGQIASLQSEVARLEAALAKKQEKPPGDTTGGDGEGDGGAATDG